jgi:hypothetical protein
MPFAFGGSITEGYSSPLPVFTRQLRWTMSLIAAVNKHIRASSGMESILLPFKALPTLQVTKARKPNWIFAGHFVRVCLSGIFVQCLVGTNDRLETDEEVIVMARAACHEEDPVALHQHARAQHLPR